MGELPLRALNLGDLNAGMEELYQLWDEIGFDETAQRDRSQTVENHFKGLLDRMIKEDYGLKKRLVKSLKYSVKQCVKLSKELVMSYEEPDSDQTLLKLEHALREEAKRLEAAREDRMTLLLSLRRFDEELSQRLGLAPYSVSYSNVPTLQKIEELREHIRSLESEKLVRLEQFVELKEHILVLYTELEEEPESDFEREVVCENTDSFVLSTANIAAARGVVIKLEEKIAINKRLVIDAMEKLDSLYKQLQLDMSEKVHFTSVNQGHGLTVISRMLKEVERLEEIKKIHIEKLINTQRNKLHKLWDDCFYTAQQRNRFSPLHSTDFTGELLEEHTAEVTKMEKYFNDNKELLSKVALRQEVWNKFIELERRAKDPSRLLKARGTSLLVEEKERNKVNKNLPQVEQELEQLISDWEMVHQVQFLVGGVSYKEFIEVQKEAHLKQLEAEKNARDMQKKLKLLQETRYGAKPSTPARLKTQGRPSRMISRVRGMMTSMRSPIRSPIGGRVAKGTSPRVGGKPVIKNKKALGAKEMKIKKGILVDKSSFTSKPNDATIARMTDQSVASTAADYSSFQQGNLLSSTAASMSSSAPEVATGLFQISAASFGSKLLSRLGGESSKPPVPKSFIKRPFVN